MIDSLLQTAFGNFALQRRPPVQGLRAWDAADEYLIETAAAATSTSALVINDTFGALACALHHAAPVSWSDSFMAHLATQENWRRNALASTPTTLPATARPGPDFDLVLWRVPKSQALFEQQIAHLHGTLAANCRVIAGGMDKHLLPDTRALLERLGQVDVLPGKKKAHLFLLKPDATQPPPPEPAPVELELPAYGLKLRGDANVFARAQLDAGARLLIEQFPKLPPARRIADIGCGNGVLSLVLARLRSDAEIHCFDESTQAVAAAKANWQHNIGEPIAERFHLDDGLTHYNNELFDLILCNPPFHQHHVIGDHIARQLFAQSRRHLRKGGQLWVVGNRHLGYHARLQQLFGNCRPVAANAKFCVLSAIARDH